MAVAVDEARKRVLAIYSDRLMFLFDTSNMVNKVCLSSFAHSGPICDLQKIPRSLRLEF